MRDGAGADELKSERERLGAHVQFFHAGCSPCSPIILRVSPHSFSLPVFTCAPDPQLSPERTLQGKNRPKPPWNRNTTRETGENKTSLIFFSLFSPSLFFSSAFFCHLPHLPRCLSTVSEGIELKKNEDYNFFLALSRGVFRPLGAGDRGFPQLSADR